MHKLAQHTQRRSSAKNCRPIRRVRPARRCLAALLAAVLVVSSATPLAWALDWNWDWSRPNAISETYTETVDATYYIALCPDATTYPDSLSAMEQILHGYTSGIFVADAFNAAGLEKPGSDDAHVVLDRFAGEGAEIDDRLVHKPTTDQIDEKCRASISDYDSITYTVVWYVVKDINNDWHIDGMLIPASIVPPDPSDDPSGPGTTDPTDPDPVDPTPQPDPNPVVPDPVPGPVDPDPVVDPTPQPGTDPIVPEEDPEPATPQPTQPTDITKPNDRPIVTPTQPAAPVQDSAPATTTHETVSMQEVDQAAQEVAQSLSMVSPLTDPAVNAVQPIAELAQEAVMSPMAAQTLRVAGAAGAVVAVIGLGLAGAGAVGAVQGLGSADSVLRNAGRRF